MRRARLRSSSRPRPVCSPLAPWSMTTLEEVQVPSCSTRATCGARKIGLSAHFSRFFFCESRARARRMKPLMVLLIVLGPAILAFACGERKLLFASGNGGAGGAPSMPADASAGGAPNPGSTSAESTSASSSSASSSSGSASGSAVASSGSAGGPDAGYDGPPYLGPCGPWTDDAMCHEGPPPFTVNCNLASECAKFAHCQQVACVQSVCCFSVTNDAPVTCGPAECVVDADCGSEGGAPGPCVALACVAGKCVGTFTGQCCSP